MTDNMTKSGDDKKIKQINEKVLTKGRKWDIILGYKRNGSGSLYGYKRRSTQEAEEAPLLRV